MLLFFSAIEKRLSAIADASKAGEGQGGDAAYTRAEAAMLMAEMAKRRGDT